jgi:anthranilate phosphoribosyltransferase
MEKIEELTQLITGGQNLSWEQSESAASLLASPEVELSAKHDFLIALSEKGETSTEVAAFASVFRSLAIAPGVDQWATRAIDVCGTGGDGAHTFNISTAVSFIVAAAGVPVFKHGNRSITSKCGSADLLEALGFHLEASQALIHQSLKELNYCFFFAPAYHPAFKEIMPVRKALAASGRRSIFNLLGPLINPGSPAYQLMGVFADHWVEPIADALDAIGLKAGLVAHCTPGEGLALDELSCAGHNHVAGVGRLRSRRGGLLPGEAGLDACLLDSLKGGEVQDNLTILHALFEGDFAAVAKGLVDSILLNAGAALWIAEQAEDISTGVDMAREVIQTGQAKVWLSNAQAFYANA